MSKCHLLVSMDIWDVFILTFIATVACTLPLKPENECLPCSESKCSIPPSNCKNGSVLVTCDCCKICAWVTKMCGTEIKNTDNSVCKWVQSLFLDQVSPKSYVLRAHRKGSLLSSEAVQTKLKSSTHNFTKIVAQTAYWENNIITDKPHVMNIWNRRNKRYIKQDSFVEWGRKIGEALSGIAAKTASETPMKAALYSNFNDKNIPSQSAIKYTLPLNMENKTNYANPSNRMLDELMTDITSGIASTVVSTLGGVFSSIVNSVLQTPVKANAEGQIHVENKPDKVYRSADIGIFFDKHREKRLLKDVNNGIQKPTRMVIRNKNFSADDGHFRNKREAQYWVVQIGRVLGSIIAGALRTIASIIKAPMKAAFDSLLNNENISHQQDIIGTQPESYYSHKYGRNEATNMFDQLLGYVGSSIGSIIVGVISSTFSSLVNSVFHFPMNANVGENIYVENKPFKTFYRTLRNKRSLNVIKDSFDNIAHLSHGEYEENYIPFNKANTSINEKWSINKITAADEHSPGAVMIYRNMTNATKILSTLNLKWRSKREVQGWRAQLGKVLAAVIFRAFSTIADSFTKTPMKVPLSSQMNFGNISHKKYSTKLWPKNQHHDVNRNNKSGPIDQMLRSIGHGIGSTNLQMKNKANEILFTGITNKNAIEFFSDIIASGLKNIYRSLVATNLIKRATNGDLVPTMKLLSDTLLHNNAEILSYITNTMLMQVSGMSTDLGSLNLIRTKFIKNNTELSEEGTKACTAAMIAINALTAPSVTEDVGQFLDTAQKDAGLLLKQLLKTDLSQTILTKELTHILSKIAIPFTKVIGDVLKELAHNLMELIYANTLNKTSLNYPIAPHAHISSVIDALLDRVLIITDSSVADTIGNLMQTILQKEIFYIAEMIRNDGFLGSIINNKCLSFVPKLAQKYGAFITEKLGCILKIIIKSLHKLAFHIKNRDHLSPNYITTVITKIPDIHKTALLIERFLYDIGKGIEDIVKEILQNDFVSNRINLNIRNSLLNRTHVLRENSGEAVKYLVETFLRLLDSIITGSKKSIFKILEENLNSDIITAFEAVAYTELNILDKILSYKNIQLQNAADKLGLLGENALKKFTSSTLAKTFFNKKFVQRLSNLTDLHRKTINRCIGYLLYKGYNKIHRKYDMNVKHAYVINDFIVKAASAVNIQKIKHLIKLTMLNIGTLISNLLKSELLNQVINNETAMQLSQFALESAHSLAEMLAAISEQILYGIHVLASDKQETGIRRAKRNSENLLQSVSEIAYHGYNIILKGITYITSPQIVKFINNIIVLVIKAVAKLTIDMANTDTIKKYVNQNTLKATIDLAQYIDDNGAQILSAAITAVFNYVHTITTSSTLSPVHMPWNKISELAKKGFVLIGELVSSISTSENINIMKDFIHILSAGLADIIHDILNSNLMRRMVGTDLAVSLSTLLKDIVTKISCIGTWLLEKNMKMIHYILAQYGFSNKVSEHINVDDVIPNMNNLLLSLVSIVKQLTAPDVVQDVVDVINIIIVKGTQLAVNLIKSNLGVKLLNQKLADAAVAFADALGLSGGRLVSMLVQRTLNFIHTIVSDVTRSLVSQNTYREVSKRISFNNLSIIFRKVLLYMSELLLKVINDRNIAAVKFLTKTGIQGTVTSIGAIINSKAGHQFLMPDFAAQLESILIFVGKYAGSIAGGIIGKLLKLFGLAMKKLKNYLSTEVGSRMMLADVTDMIKHWIISLTKPEMASDLENLILMTGREGGVLLSRIFRSPFTKNLINTQLAEGLSQATLTISQIVAKIIAFVIKGAMNIVHNIFTDQRVYNHNNPSFSEERKYFSYRYNKRTGIFEYIINIVNSISNADNARTVKDLIIVIGKGLGILIKKILQTDLAHKIINPTFSRDLGNIAVFIGNKGSQLLGYLIEQSLTIVHKVSANVEGKKIQNRSFKLNMKSLAQTAMQVAKYLLKQLTNPNSANLLKDLIKGTLKEMGNIIARVLRSDFAKRVLNVQLATYAADFILKTSHTGAEFMGSVIQDIFGIIYKMLSQTNHDVIRTRRSTQNLSEWQMLSNIGTKGLRYLQKVLKDFTNPEIVTNLKNIVINTGKETGSLIAYIAQSKFALLILNKQVSQGIAEFAKTVGHLGGRFLGEIIAAALNYIHYLTSFYMGKDIATRSGISWYNISSAGLKGLEFIGKIMSYISASENKKIIKDFIYILSVGLADLTRALFQSKIAIRLVGLNLATTLSSTLAEIVNKLGNVGALLLEKNLALIHSLLAQFNYSNISINDILPKDLLHSTAQIVKKMTAPEIVEDVTDLVKIIVNKITTILIRLIRSELAETFLNHRLINLMVNVVSVMGNSGGKLASVYIKRAMDFINSALSEEEISTRLMDKVSTRNSLQGIASSFQKVLLYSVNLILELLHEKNIAYIKSLVNFGIEKSLTFTGILINSRMMGRILTPSFASQLQNIIAITAKYAGSILAEISGKLLELLVYLAKSIKVSLSKVRTRIMSLWQPHNVFQNSRVRSEMKHSFNDMLFMLEQKLSDTVKKLMSAEMAKIFLYMLHLFA